MPFKEFTNKKKYPAPKGAYGWFWFKMKENDDFRIVEVQSEAEISEWLGE